MPLDWPTELRKEAEHLVLLSKDPAWTEHARLRRDERLADPVWAGLRDEIVKVRAAQQPAADAASGAKP